MTFTYRHKKEIIFCILGLVLLLVVGTVLIYRNFNSNDSSKENIVLNTKKENLDEEEQEEVYYQIDIKGEVNVPGIYTVKEGSRVIDVIRLAGDLTEDADTSVLNLSKKVADEMVIIVYSYDEVTSFTETLEKEKSDCDGCPYGRVHPCIGWCTKQIMREIGIKGQRGEGRCKGEKNIPVISIRTNVKDANTFSHAGGIAFAITHDVRIRSGTAQFARRR